MTKYEEKHFDAHLSRKYNIIYIIDGLGMGGAERLMVPILRNLSKKYFQPRVCVLQNKDGNPVADDIRALDVPVDFLSVPYLRDITAIPRIRNYLKETNADLVHTQLEFADSLGNFASKLLHLPSVCTIHTMPSPEMDFKTRMHQWIEWLSLRLFCDRIISVSEEARQHHLSISNEVPEKIITLYNGIDLDPYEVVDAEENYKTVRQELGISIETTLLITVAVLRELKGIQFMIRALSAIVTAFPDTYYLVVGDGSYRKALEDEAFRAGVQDHVLFIGLRKDIPRLLSASDVFVLPTMTEALPTVLAEAMAARLPIVASNVGGVPEMIRSGENGILVTAGNIQELALAVKTLLGSPIKMQQMGEKGWEVVNNKFNIAEQVRHLEQCYLGLIKQYEK